MHFSTSLFTVVFVLVVAGTGIGTCTCMVIDITVTVLCEFGLLALIETKQRAEVCSIAAADAAVRQLDIIGALWMDVHYLARLLPPSGFVLDLSLIHI